MNFLTPEQVAELLKVDSETVELWLKQKKLPGVKIGNVWRIEEGRLQEFLTRALDAASKYEEYEEPLSGAGAKRRDLDGDARAMADAFVGRGGEIVEIVDEARSGMDGYAKRFKFILGHDIGKLEVCGLLDGKLVLKQIHARSGHKAQASRLILQEIGDGDGWVSLE